jgi:hypothetical protein
VTDEELTRIARGYRTFVDEAVGSSPLYGRLAADVTGDGDILRFLAELPVGKRQPNLLFAAVQYLHGAPEDGRELHRLVVEDGERLRMTMTARATQTNEPARCAALLPVLARLDGPLALIEVGASAGLCLYPDRYSYEYDGRPVGARSPVHLRCTTTGDLPLPARLPDVAARIGIDLNPLDAADPDDRAWLRALVWPGPNAADRLQRLDAAAEICWTGCRTRSRSCRPAPPRSSSTRRCCPMSRPTGGPPSSSRSRPSRSGGSPRRRRASSPVPARRRPAAGEPTSCSAWTGGRWR